MSSAAKGSLPVAVWSGDLLGMRVHVLDDGRRVIEGGVEAIERLLSRDLTDDDIAKVSAFMRPGAKGIPSW